MAGQIPSKQYQPEMQKSDALKAQNATWRTELARLQNEMGAADAVSSQAIVHTATGDPLNIQKDQVNERNEMLLEAGNTFEKLNSEIADLKAELKIKVDRETELENQLGSLKCQIEQLEASTSVIRGNEPFTSSDKAINLDIESVNAIIAQLRKTVEWTLGQCASLREPFSSERLEIGGKETKIPYEEKLVKKEIGEYDGSVTQKSEDTCNFNVKYEEQRFVSENLNLTERNPEIYKKTDRNELLVAKLCTIQEQFNALWKNMKVENQDRPVTEFNFENLAEEKAKELERIQEKFFAIEPQILSLLEERESLTKLVIESQELREASTNDREVLKIEIEQLRSYLETKEKEIAQLQKSLTDARREIGELTTTNIKLKSRDMCEQHEQIISSLQKKVNEMQHEAAQNMIDLVNSKKEKLKVEESMRKLKDEMKKMQDEKKESEKKRDRVQSKHN